MKTNNIKFWLKKVSLGSNLNNQKNYLSSIIVINYYKKRLEIVNKTEFYLKRTIIGSMGLKENYHNGTT